MWTVAGEAFAVLHRLMLDLGGGCLLLEIVVTIEAELPVGFDQHPFVIGSMRVVA